MTDILDSFKKTRAAVKAVLNQWGLEVSSSGTKFLNLPNNAFLDTATGYWDLAANRGILNKPPRWILHVSNRRGTLVTDFARDSAGNTLPSANSVGYANNRVGKSSVTMVRLIPAFEDGNSGFKFVDGWEWLIVFAFGSPLPPGTSGELLSKFDLSSGTLEYKGNLNSKSKPYAVPIIGIIKSSDPLVQIDTQISGKTFKYDDCTTSLQNFFSSGTAKVYVCDPDNDSELSGLAKDIENSIKKNMQPKTLAPKKVTSASNLLGIHNRVYDLINASLKTGKKHFIFYGPPGTGKTTLAEHVAEQLSDDNSFIQLTASSSWSSQDLVGGYQPTGGGNISFIPGVMLKNFDSPIIIDEMNRCPIDKVIGPLFSVLSGQASTLPYRVDISDPSSDSYKILPSLPPSKSVSEFAPGDSWSMICTLNQVDKTQLGQLSYALSRRFAWIRIGIPDNPHHFLVDILERLGFLKNKKDYNAANPIADMWIEVNKLRELGGAPFIDMVKLLRELDKNIDLLSDPANNQLYQELLMDSFAASVSPLLDGIRTIEADELSNGIAKAWSLDNGKIQHLKLYLDELAI